MASYNRNFCLKQLKLANSKTGDLNLLIIIAIIIFFVIIDLLIVIETKDYNPD